jgi:cytochrome c-type biogenesis protein CcmH
VKTSFSRITLAFVWTAAVVAQSPASTGDAAFEQRFNAFVLQVRCLVCQNESLAESRAELAADLRREIRGQMRAGRSDDEIRAFLTDRYGDFVLYRPPLKLSTYPLWFGPFILLAAGGIALYRVVTRVGT